MTFKINLQHKTSYRRRTIYLTDDNEWKIRARIARSYPNYNLVGNPEVYTGDAEITPERRQRKSYQF